MSAKTKPAKGTTKKQAAAPAANVEPVVESGTEVVFTKLRSPIAAGEPEFQIREGERVFISGHNPDDDSYNVARTPKGKPIETLFRGEFVLATEAKTTTKTEAEDAAAKAKPVKDKAGKTVVEAKPGKSAKKGKEAKTEAPPEKPAVIVKVLGTAKKAVDEAGSLIKAAELLVERQGSNDFDLGCILAKIEQTAAFEQITDTDGTPKYGTGQPGFAKFCAIHLNTHYRKAQYLIGNYVAAQAAGLTAKQVGSVGWSKFKEIAGLLTADNADELLAEAKNLTLDNLTVAMRKRKVAMGIAHGNTTHADLTTFTFKLFNDKAEVLREALDKAKKALGIEGDDVVTNSQALDHIASQFLSLSE